MFLWIIQLKNVFVENHGLWSEIDMVSIDQPLKVCWIQMQMCGAYNKVQ